MKQVATQNKEYVELTSLSQLYSDPDKDGNQKLVKSDIKARLSVYIDDIQAHEEVISNSGKLLKDRVRIHHRGIGSIVVKQTYDYISQLKQPQQHKAGFKH